MRDQKPLCNRQLQSGPDFHSGPTSRSKHWNESQAAESTTGRCLGLPRSRSKPRSLQVLELCWIYFRLVVFTANSLVIGLRYGSYGLPLNHRVVYESLLGYSSTASASLHESLTAAGIRTPLRNNVNSCRK